MRYLLDTNVICEATARAPNPNVIQWLEMNSEECAISALTLGEIWKGIHLLPSGKRKKSISGWANSIEAEFKNLTLQLDSTTFKIWAKFYASHQSKGRNLILIDSLLAATSLEHNLILVTRNTRDFPSTIPTLNPWLPQDRGL